MARKDLKALSSEYEVLLKQRPRQTKVKRAEKCFDFFCLGVFDQDSPAALITSEITKYENTEI